MLIVRQARHPHAPVGSGHRKALGDTGFGAELAVADAEFPTMAAFVTEFLN
ncbi:hypothetical protein [Thalassobaculum sp.]|uniref:hypothetical protein n=1 Tax=Thalassobaculum sp. TaxID=2022740 RepID=UPI003B5C8076